MGLAAMDPAGDDRPEIVIADEASAPGVRAALTERLQAHPDVASRAA